MSGGPRRWRPEIHEADLTWFGAAAVISVGGFMVQLAFPSVRAAGAGLLILFVGLWIGTVRVVLQRLARLDDRIAGGSDTYVDNGLANELAGVLWQEEVDAHRERLDALREGSVAIRSQTEAIDYFFRFAGAARATFVAVDHIALSQWFGNPRLADCLALQLKRASEGRLHVSRLRFVSEAQTSSATERQLLREFVRLHDEAGVDLMLCPEEDARALGTSFFPRTGAVVVDYETKPACLIARLDDSGYLETATAYLRPLGPVKATYRDYVLLRDATAERGWDRLIRERLAQVADAPGLLPQADEGLRHLPLGGSRDDP